jgi:hypothetical protein
MARRQQHLQLVKNKTERETQPKGHSPHARDNQLQVGSIGDSIRPLVAEILIFTYRSAGGGGSRCPLLVFVALWQVHRGVTGFHLVRDKKVEKKSVSGINLRVCRIVLIHT